MNEKEETILDLSTQLALKKSELESRDIHIKQLEKDMSNHDENILRLKKKNENLYHSVTKVTQEKKKFDEANNIMMD